MSKYYQCCKFNFTHGNQHSAQDRVFTKSYQCFSYLKFNIVHGNKDTRHPKKKKKIINTETRWKMKQKIQLPKEVTQVTQWS